MKQKSLWLLMCTVQSPPQSNCDWITPIQLVRTKFTLEEPRRLNVLHVGTPHFTVQKHRGKGQMFAHCERSNTIMLWRWMGATKPNQPVVAAIASFKLPAYWQVPISDWHLVESSRSRPPKGMCFFLVEHVQQC